MSIMSKQVPLVAVAAAATGLIVSAPPLRAATAAAEATADESPVEVIVTGTRQKGVEAAESLTPIQIIGASELKDTGQPNLINALAQLVPSFIAQASGTDMANNTLQARLRGLSPNDVLILVNGKRRHTTANLAVISGPYQGGAGADLNFIPVDAIDHVEVLTEGAAAQYGTDAIVGVINIILKKNSSGGEANASYGGYFDGGGSTTQVGANAGFQPLPDSYFNVTGNVYNHAGSFRGWLDARLLNPSNLTQPSTSANAILANMQNAPGFPYLARGSGDGEQHRKVAAFNSGFRIADGVQFYATGTYGWKEAESFEGYRLSNVAYYKSPVTGAYTYPYPYGFDPKEQAKETDYQLNAGLTGAFYDWSWDLAYGYGSDQFNMYTIHSINAQLYKNTGFSPTDFYDGEFQATQGTVTLDMSRDFDMGLAGPLNVAFGGEYRREAYKILPGDSPSYVVGGAQSFPGFPPGAAEDRSRRSYAGYLDLAVKPLSNVRLDLAGRYEHYTDFGSAKVGKLTARWDIVPAFAMRGTVSTGFRAPTLAEEFYTALNVGPTSANAQLAPDGSAAALLGLGSGLKPEKSTNVSFGLVFQPLANLTATFDAYQIILTNRIVGTGTITGQNLGVPYPPGIGTPAVIAALTASGLPIDPAVVQSGSLGVALFTNGIDTRTRGVDFTLTSPNDLPLIGHVDFSLAGTYNYTTLTGMIASPAQLSGQPLFNPTTISNLTTASPHLVANFGARWSPSVFYVDLHEIVYGHSQQMNNDSGLNPTGQFIYYPYRIGTVCITNLELGLKATQQLTFALGATNLFNRYPNHVNPAVVQANLTHYQGGTLTKWDTFAPFGFDGGFYYARATFNF
jgi:iron complex outermembrane recepter protein